MLSSGSRIAIFMMVLLMAGTAAYWVFLAEPGHDPLAVLEHDDDGFLDADPDDLVPSEPDVLVLGGADRGPALATGPTPDADAADAPLIDDDELRRLRDEVDRTAAEERDDDGDRIVRPWDTMRRVAAGGPIRIGGDERSGRHERPAVGDDDRDSDAGKGSEAFGETGEAPPAERPQETVPLPPAPTPEPERRADAATAWGEHVVQHGDTVVAIAETWFGEPGHWDLVLRANPGVDPTRLSIGQRLRLPPRSWRPEPSESPDGDGSGSRMHEVRPGETLSVIARAHYGRVELWRRIYDANRETIGADPGRLKVGMRLRIPPVE